MAWEIIHHGELDPVPVKAVSYSYGTVRSCTPTSTAAKNDTQKPQATDRNSTSVAEDIDIISTHLATHLMSTLEGETMHGVLTTLMDYGADWMSVRPIIQVFTQKSLAFVDEVTSLGDSIKFRVGLLDEPERKKVQTEIKNALKSALWRTQ